MSRKAPSGGLHAEITLPHEEEWELWHNSFSLCSRKLRICLSELGLAWRSHEINLIETGRYENVSPAFLAVNPAGTVPVLVHAGHPVYESHDQIVYAAAHAGRVGAELFPADAGGRELVEVWVDRASLVGDPMQGRSRRAGHCVPGLTLPLFATMVAEIPAREILRGLLTHPNKERPVAFLLLKLFGIDRFPKLGFFLQAVQRSREAMGVHLDALAVQLKSHGGPWIAGGSFTLADVSWMVLLDRLVEADWERVFWAEGQRPLVAAYWQRSQERSSYAAEVERRRCPEVRAGIAALIAAKAQNPALRAALEGI